MSQMLVRRALPTLWISNEEYEVLDGLARDREITVADLIKEVISPLVEGNGDGRVVVLRLPEHTWEAFVEFFEGDMRFVLQSMSAHVEHGGDDFARALKAAREME